jgi:glycosyltransferase involved in cell wall biosynthesis
MTGLRVVMFVLNQVKHDRRVLREAASLVEAGCQVTIFGVTGSDSSVVDDEQHPSGFRIVRVPVPARSRLWSSRRADFVDAWDGARDGRWTARRLGGAAAATPWWLAKSVVAAASYAMHLGTGGNATFLLNSRLHWRRWRRAVLEHAPRADVFHGHDMAGLHLAVAAQRRFGGRVVYDSHDLFVEAGRNASRPPAVKRMLAADEGRLYRQADLVITVNRGLADELHRRYGEKPIAVVHNCVPAWRPPARRGRGPLRRALGLKVTTPLVLYHGGFTPNRGLDVLIAAMSQPGLERVHLALLGYGPLEAEVRALAGDARTRGQAHVLSAVPPDELDGYVADADVAAMVNQPTSLNEVLSTPNKLFESIAAGVPIVTSDFPMRREIVVDNPEGPLGAACDPQSPASVAEAIRSIIDLPAADAAALRARCRQAAARRWNWELEAETLVAAYRHHVAGETSKLPIPVSNPPVAESDVRG